MSNEKFVYVTYIAATPEKVWAALTQGDLTRQWWKSEVASSWKPGSNWEFVQHEEQHTCGHSGTVVESVLNKRLVFTWGSADDVANKIQPSKVSIDLDTVDEKLRLTVTHEELTLDELRSISHGWPLVLSSLKSFLETGKPLDF